MWTGSRGSPPTRTSSPARWVSARELESVRAAILTQPHRGGVYPPSSVVPTARDSARAALVASYAARLVERCESALRRNAWGAAPSSKTVGTRSGGEQEQRGRCPRTCPRRGVVVQWRGRAPCHVVGACRPRVWRRAWDGRACGTARYAVMAVLSVALRAETAATHLENAAEMAAMCL